MVTDLIVAKLKYQDRSRKDIMREDTGTSIIRRKVAGFENVIDYHDYIDCVFKMNQTVSMYVVYQFCCDNECVDINRDTDVKRSKDLRIQLAFYD